MARNSRGLTFCATALWVAGCAGAVPDNESEAVFSNPAAYVGKQVRLCGYIHDRFEDTNIWPSRSASLRGERELGFFDDDKARMHELDGKSVCIKVEIVRTGLGEKDENGEFLISNATMAKFGASRVAD